MSDEEKQKDDRVRAFLQSLDRLARSTAEGSALSKRLIDATGKHVEVSALLFDAITKDKDGLICAIDDLISEIQGLREDFRAFAKAGGLQVSFGSLFGTGRRR